MRTNTICANQTRTGKPLLGVITLVLAIATAAATPAAAQGPIMVEDPGDGIGTGGRTLRQAIAEAQATPSDDTIVFANDISVINLSQGELLLGYLFMPPNSGSLTIDGGVGVTIDAGGQSAVMEIQSGTVILQGLAFVNGYNDLGGGLMIWDGTDVTLEYSLVSDNVATNAGGGIFNAGVLTMNDTVVSRNYSRDAGGGVFTLGDYSGSLAAAGSTFSENEARGGGGGIYNSGAEVMLIDPIVSYNTARNGGGIYNDGGIDTLSILGGVFTGNQASRNGGDIYYTAGSFDPTGFDGLDLFEEPLKGKGGGRR